MILRRSLQALFILGLSAWALSGCFDGGGYGGYGGGPAWGGYGYPDYPVYGYAPYGVNRGYAPAFEVHHGWEGHYEGGHHDSFYHAPVAHAGGGGHAIESRGAGGSHGSHGAHGGGDHSGSHH